ncbi:FliO/MopB family protein [Azospirillum largimobile]
MDLDQYIRFLMALFFVVALIMVVAWVMRRVGMAGGTVRGRARQRRLSVVEALPIDAKRRLILVRRDDREHLILLSANGDLLVDSGTAGGFDSALALSTERAADTASARSATLSAPAPPAATGSQPQ